MLKDLGEDYLISFLGRITLGDRVKQKQKSFDDLYIILSQGEVGRKDTGY